MAIHIKKVPSSVTGLLSSPPSTVIHPTPRAAVGVRRQTNKPVGCLCLSSPCIIWQMTRNHEGGVTKGDSGRTTFNCSPHRMNASKYQQGTETCIIKLIASNPPDYVDKRETFYLAEHHHRRLKWLVCIFGVLIHHHHPLADWEEASEMDLVNVTSLHLQRAGGCCSAASERHKEMIKLYVMVDMEPGQWARRHRSRTRALAHLNGTQPNGWLFVASVLDKWKHLLWEKKKKKVCCDL